MPDFVTLTCPACGGKLHVTKEIDKFACGHCGSEHLVRREGGLIYLAPLVAGIAQIRTGVDKTAAELAVAVGGVLFAMAQQLARKRNKKGGAILDEHIKETKRLFDAKRKALKENQRLLDG